MKEKSIGIVILWWCEMIVAIRVLLFAIPVMINKCSAKTFSLANIDDRFMGLVTLTAIVYFVVGALSISKNALGQKASIAAVVVIMLVTFASLGLSGQAVTAAEGYYFSPLLLSVIVTALAWILGGAKKAA